MTVGLVLIDLQEDFLSAPGLVPHRAALEASVAALLAAFRNRGGPVVHIWTTIRTDRDERMGHWRRNGDQRCREGTPGHAPPAALGPLASETIVHKTAFSGFHGTSLDAELRGLGIGAVVLTGVHLHGCVRATALDAYQRGLNVSIVDDGVASADALHADVTRRYLATRGITFTPADALLAQIAALGAARVPPGVRSSVHVLPATRVGERTRPGQNEGAHLHRSPRASGEPLWLVPDAGADDVAHAVETAKEAGLAWRRVPGPRRAELLMAIAERLDRERGALAERLAVEIGKPVTYGRAEVGFAADLVRAAAGRARRVRVGPPHRTMARRRPLGVVALVTPWNNPVAVPLGKLAPALAFGNTVVWKPAVEGTGRALELLEWLTAAGLPAGVASVVVGGRGVAEQLMLNPGVDALTLTGSDAAGATARAIAAQRSVPLQAELGGNNGAIVWGDTDLVAAAGAIAEGAFGSAGQRCTATRRVIVDASCAGGFLAHLEAATVALGWGDPLAEQTTVGPLVAARAVDRVERAVARARSDGSTIRTPHQAAGRAAPGPLYLPPTIVEAFDPAQEIVNEETFGPVLVVQRALSWDDALDLLNRVRQGLAAALFSPSPGRQASFLERAQAGVLKVNQATAGVGPLLPFGGWKASGSGPPEHGAGDREFYTRPQAVYY